MNINEFLTKHYKLSSEESIAFIQEQEVFINHKQAIQRQHLERTDALSVNGVVIREAQHFSYYAFYKPRGIECTLNPGITDNLFTILPFDEHVFPIGRLDKESEGLLILTNDGVLYKDIAFAEKLKEKEYIVEVDRLLTRESIQQWADGIVIKGRKTRPALVFPLTEKSFRIILTQGVNRQIRRMCYKLGYEVISLKRIRITSIILGDLNPGEYRVLSKQDFDRPV